MTSILVNIDVDGLERGLDFYTRALDLRVGRRLGPEIVELLGAEAPIYLLAKPAGSRSSPASSQPRDYRRHWTPVHLDVSVTDIEAAVARAVAAGAALEGAIGTHAFGRMATLADPFGHGLCLIEFQGRGYDALADEGPIG
jgi:predicted enzyme related to lactoylglutathione lyase